MSGGQARDDVSAIILGGGKSSRMGRPKALLLFDGEPLIVHIARALESLFSDIVIVAAPGQELPALPVTLVRDEVAYQGPVGGIYYGLRAASGEIGFVTSCDVPFLSLPLISFLISQIADYDVVVPYWQERLQPLHAVYRRSVVPLLQEQLERGELRPISLYKKVRTREVHEDEIRGFDPDGMSFLNMNTPEDYQAALRRWQDTRQRQRNQTETTPPLSVSNPCLTCTVELFSVARLVAKTSKVSLALPQGATLSHVFLALAERLPILVGPVITPERNSLTSGNACNINGKDFVRDPSVKVRAGDSIIIISADAGG
jgi:molybdopterin-guanine dinucleotide biosynthesis protein A/molybdopterin converting factor small subunit